MMAKRTTNNHTNQSKMCPGVENGGPALIGQAFGGFGGPGRRPIINENQANGHKERETGPNSPWDRGLAILLIYLYHICIYR